MNEMKKWFSFENSEILWECRRYTELTPTTSFTRKYYLYFKSFTVM